ncbi:hypothetical protein NSQ43_02190 [Sporosarcina sp. FSL W8-0480]|uniref:hypothetical protein n=1 Tax=Sporosarcina sp. FSL W8-0480 TaxID=2954701 RepID=UPI0030DDAA5D
MAEAIFMFILFIPVSVLMFFAPQYEQEHEFSPEATLVIKISDAIIAIEVTLNLIVNIINIFR